MSADEDTDGLLIIGIWDSRPPARETNRRIDEMEVVLVAMMVGRLVGW